MLKTVLSPSGRRQRPSYWRAAALVPSVAILALLAVVVAVSMLHGSAGLISAAATISSVAAMAVGLVAIWAGFTIGIQRLHDRDLSGWWVLIALLPVGGPIWYLFWNGLKPGTLGPNRFGPDPRLRYAALAVFEDGPSPEAVRPPVVSIIVAWLCLLAVLALSVLLFQNPAPRQHGGAALPVERWKSKDRS